MKIRKAPWRQGRRVVTSGHWIDTLPPYACGEAVRWCRTQASLEAAWAVCERGDWMLWYADRRSGEPWGTSRRRLVLAACECARLALPYVPAGELRPLQAIEAAERWGRGEDIAVKDVRAAYAAAYNAVRDTTYAAYAAASAASSVAALAYSDASCAANAAASAAAGTTETAASAAREAALRTCAEIVRRHFPVPPTPQVEPAE